MLRCCLVIACLCCLLTLQYTPLRAQSSASTCPADITTTAPRPTAAGNFDANNCYIVVPGDTLRTIARRFCVPVGRLATINNFSTIEVKFNANNTPLTLAIPGLAPCDATAIAQDQVDLLLPRAGDAVGRYLTVVFTSPPEWGANNYAWVVVESEGRELARVPAYPEMKHPDQILWRANATIADAGDARQAFLEVRSNRGAEARIPIQLGGPGQSITIDTPAVNAEVPATFFVAGSASGATSLQIMTLAKPAGKSVAEPVTAKVDPATGAWSAVIDTSATPGADIEIVVTGNGVVLERFPVQLGGAACQVTLAAGAPYYLAPGMTVPNMRGHFSSIASLAADAELLIGATRWYRVPLADPQDIVWVRDADLSGPALDCEGLPTR
ncbi:MAG: LysM peptidoglycan-binding domain-containing protein [Anaerolineales bacterium]|nr:LysM peptidoglycan-binding domain-containing protein [Anaerolineales bacterium]